MSFSPCQFTLHILHLFTLHLDVEITSISRVSHNDGSIRENPIPSNGSLRYMTFRFWRDHQSPPSYRHGLNFFASSFPECFGVWRKVGRIQFKNNIFPFSKICLYNPFFDPMPQKYAYIYIRYIYIHIYINTHVVQTPVFEVLCEFARN